MKKLFSKADAILIAVLLLAAAVLLVSMRSTGKETYARIEKEGETLWYFRLSEDLPYREYEIEGEIPVVIAAEKGSIWFVRSDCPDHLCVRIGKLSKSGETAVCLPAKVAVTVEGAEKTIDAVTG